MKPLKYVFRTSIFLEISSLMTSAQLLYTFPQSVGIAGGRPSSSYYFVGSQADNLFYLDPHNTRPAIPLRPVPSPGQRELTPESDIDSFNYRHTRSPVHQRAPTSPSSVRTGSSTFSYHAPVSPSHFNSRSLRHRLTLPSPSHHLLFKVDGVLQVPVKLALQWSRPPTLTIGI